MTAEVYNFILNRTYRYTGQGLDIFGSKTSSLDVCVPVTIHIVNKGLIQLKPRIYQYSSSQNILLLLPLALQSTVGFGLSNNILPFLPICHQLSPSSHSQRLKISFYFLFPSFPGSSPSSRPFQFLSEDLLGILSSFILSSSQNMLIIIFRGATTRIYNILHVELMYKSFCTALH